MTTEEWKQLLVLLEKIRDDHRPLSNPEFVYTLGDLAWELTYIAENEIGE